MVSRHIMHEKTLRGVANQLMQSIRVYHRRRRKEPAYSLEVEAEMVSVLMYQVAKTSGSSSH